MEILLIVSIFISGILNLIMGVLVIIGSKEKKSSLPFALFSFATFLVALSYYFIYRSDFADSVRFSYSFGVLIPTFLLAWVYNFTTKNFKLWKPVVIYLVGAVFFVLPFVGKLLITNIQRSDTLGFVETTGVAFPFYVGFYVIVYCFVVLRLIAAFRSDEPEKKKQTKLILTGFAIYGALGIFFGLFLPFLGYDRLTDLDIPSTVIFVGFTTYAIVQYKWMNLKVIAVQVLALFIIGMAIMDIFMADTTGQRIYKSITFLILTTLAIILVKNVMEEVKRKEELQVMSDKLAQSNDQLRTLDNAKSEFISIASHQLRTPPTAIRGYASLILEGSYGPISSQLNDAVNKIYVANDRQIDFVEDLLNVSRIESGRMGYTFDKWKIEDLCQEAIDSLVFKAKDKNLYLDYKKSEQALPELTIDGPKIREVISNFVDNAIKYTIKGGVTLKAELCKTNSEACLQNPHIRVTVSDTGIGVPKEEIPYLFVKFSRGKDISRLNTGGTGLGLYVGKNMIEANGGKAWVESDGQGKGSRFIFEVPLEQSKETIDRYSQA